MRWIERVLFGAGFLGVLVLFLALAHPHHPAKFSATKTLHAKRPAHGGCVLYERLGPQVHLCRDGTVWHRRVDGPEYMGNVRNARPVTVPAAGG